MVCHYPQYPLHTGKDRRHDLWTHHYRWFLLLRSTPPLPILKIVRTGPSPPQQNPERYLVHTFIPCIGQHSPQQRPSTDDFEFSIEAPRCRQAHIDQSEDLDGDDWSRTVTQKEKADTGERQGGGKGVVVSR